MGDPNRLQYNGLLTGTTRPLLGASLTSGGTTITFPAALNYQGATAVPTVAAPSYVPLTLEPDTANEEIVYLTAYTSGATSGTISRGKEGTSAAAHANSAPFVHAATVLDFQGNALATPTTIAAGTTVTGKLTFGGIGSAKVHAPTGGGGRTGKAKLRSKAQQIFQPWQPWTPPQPTPVAVESGGNGTLTFSGTGAAATDMPVVATADGRRREENELLLVGAL
jgi:hypothetical protein